MHPGNSSQGGPPRHDARPQNQSASRAQRIPMRVRTEDSWIDLSSQSSFSPDVITTGLQLGQNNSRNTGQPRTDTTQQPGPRSTSVAGSSQDEYEESESDSDQIMTSSNEDVSKLQTSTTLGSTPHNHDVFTPQPNVFTHPPNSNHAYSTPCPEPPVSYARHVAYSDRLPSARMITQRQLSREQIPPSRSQPDHDAALRASLTTLLSCAAAVRPKEQLNVPATMRNNQPTTFRLVSASELNASPDGSPKAVPKRKPRESSKDRQAKKLRAVRGPNVGDDLVSPTVMTWMISAGVVLVVSAITFSAGYAWGKEVGRVEGEFSCIGCGQESIKSGSGGLRKLRWSSAAQSVRA